MAVTSVRRSGLTSLIKYDRFTAGNESDFALIESITVGSGGASSVTFSNIPQGFRHLQVRAIASTQAVMWVSAQYNNDTTKSNYWAHDLLGNGSTASSASSFSEGMPFATYFVSTSSTQLSNAFAAGIVDILDYSSTSKIKVSRSLHGRDLNGSGEVRLTSSSWNNTSSITTITLMLDNGTTFLQHSTFSLYGVR